MKQSVIFVFASILVVGCGPSDNGGRSTGGTTGKGGVDGGFATCGTHPKDTDGDGISDEDEGANEKPPRDTDRDGTPDYLDQDSDNDGIPDSVEARNGGACNPPVDTDGDGKPDFRDLDSDDANDSTVPDSEEAGADPTHPVDTDGNGAPDYMDADNDGDGILDIFELTPQGASVAAVTMATAPDTDGDGIPDFLDTDSDADTILDKDEGSVDTDGDLIPNYRDLDSDGDCVPDSAEAGDADPMTPPIDTDGDGAPDFEDVDTDNDGLTDGKEDKNCNGVLDTCETNRLLADTDGDGVSDLIEYEDCAVKPPSVQVSTNCQCDGADNSKSPLTRGDFVFVVDYMMPPVPQQETLNLTTNVSQADIIFDLDTTGSMGSSLTNLASGLSSIVPQIQTKVSNVAFGVLEFKDFGDTYVVKYDWRIQSVNTTPGLTGVHTALSALTAGGGGDGPEAGWEALYAIAGGPAFNVDGYNSVLPPWTGIPSSPALAGETQGTIGGAGFRAGSVPIVIAVSDAEWHDAAGVATNGEDGLNDYSSPTGTPSREQAITQINAIGAHVVWLAALGTAQTNNPKARAIALAQATGAVVTPADFGPVGTRPATCAITDCCTGWNNSTDTLVGEASLAGDCPLGFSVDDNTGAGVSGSVVSGIVALANGLHFDVHVQANDVDPMTVDNFIDKLVPNVSGMGTAAMCIVVPMSQLVDNFIGPHALPGAGMDGILDTFLGLSGGVQICFDVVAKENMSVMPSDQPQFFRAQLQVIGQTKTATTTNSFNLGTPRDVFFLVPPNIVNGPIG